jgi:hypothetical protein
MAKNKIEESQQQRDGVALGTQGNQDMTTPQGTEGIHKTKDNRQDHSIPNQDRSSASNQEGNKGRGKDNSLL